MSRENGMGMGPEVAKIPKSGLEKVIEALKEVGALGLEESIDEHSPLPERLHDRVFQVEFVYKLQNAFPDKEKLFLDDKFLKEYPNMTVGDLADRISPPEEKMAA